MRDFDGKYRDDIYERLVNKTDYFQTMSKISQALRPYKRIRFEHDDVIITPFSPNFKLQCKEIYKQIIKHRVTKPTAMTKWENEIAPPFEF